MTESINAEFEAYVKTELGDIAVVSEGRYISPKIQNYFKVWQHKEAQLAAVKPKGEPAAWVENSGVIPDVGSKRIDINWGNGTVTKRVLASEWPWHKHFNPYIHEWKLSDIHPPAPLPKGEPKAWLINFKDTGGNQQSRSYTHNAIGDYRQIDPDATSERLYTRPPLPKQITVDDVTDEMIDELARRCPTMNSVEVDRQTIAASFNIYNTYLAGEAT